MGSYAARFTPQLMLSAPQRSAGVSNPSGTTILYTTSSYSLQDHFHTVGLEALRVHTGQTFEIDAHQELSNPCWLDDECFFCLRAEEGGRTSVLQGFVYQPEQDQSRTTLVTAGSINAKATNMKMARIGNEFDDIAIVVTALAGRRGTLLTDENVTRKTHSSGRLYDGLFVRHWDRFEGPGTNSLWYGRLRPVEGAQYKLGKLTNLLTAARLGTPIQSFGGLDTFDIRADAIIWIARDFEMNPSTNTKCNIYIQHMVSWGSEQSFQNPRPERIDVEGFDGAAASAVFAPIGNKAAFLKMRINRYESDKNQIFVVPDVTVSKPEAVRLLSSSENSEYEGSWDRSPRSICFGASGDYLAVTADDHGHCRAFHIDLSPEMQNCRPRPLIHAGMATRLQCLNDGRIFASGTSFVDDSWYAIVDPSIVDATDSLVWSHSYSDQGANLGLQRLQVQSIRTPASDPSVNSQIHSWIFKPSNFDGTQSYPVAYLIHGGPHESWKDSWSTRWNPAVFAEQGYIVVASNPSGSTGYGQAFTNASIQNWGGAPYEDIVNVFDWVGQNVQGADNDRAVALGHSYGGYMINWIQGHDLGRKLKALVCHNGIFSSTGMLATDELHFHYYEMDGPVWEPGFVPNLPHQLGKRHQWSPNTHLENFATPQLVIHSDKDYRVPIAEGLAMFNVLQARGVPSQFLMFPDENHWVVRPENSLVWYKTVLNWINKYVGLPKFTDEDAEDAEYWGGRLDNEPLR